MLGRMGYDTHSATQSGLLTLAKLVENISNVKSIGYKKNDSSFVDTLNGEIAKYGDRDFSQGSLRRTMRLLDFALEGPGFFEVELPNGQRSYTRVGRLRLTSEGELVTDEGYRIIPEIEPGGKPVLEKGLSYLEEVGVNMKITTPRLTIPVQFTPEVTEDGTIYGVDDNTKERIKLGKINVVVFNNSQGLESVGRGYYLASSVSGNPLEADVGPGRPTRIRQEHLELANVNIAQEFLNLAQVKDFLSAQLKVFKVIDKIYENVNFTISRSV